MTAAEHDAAPRGGPPGRGGPRTRDGAPDQALHLTRLLAALERQPPRGRAVLVLRNLLACGWPEIAAAAGCPQEACRRLAAAAPGDRDGTAAPGQWSRHITGAAHVARLLAATLPPLVGIGVTLEQQPVAGRPGVLFRDRQGRKLTALALDFRDGRIHRIHVVHCS